MENIKQKFLFELEPGETVVFDGHDIVKIS